MDPLKDSWRPTEILERSLREVSEGIPDEISEEFWDDITKLF